MPDARTIHELSQPIRAEGFYWVKYNGEIVPAKYGHYSNEDIEGEFYDDHPEMNPNVEHDPVVDYGWMMDYSRDEPQVFFDKDFEWIDKDAIASAPGEAD